MDRSDDDGVIEILDSVAPRKLAVAYALVVMLPMKIEDRGGNMTRVVRSMENCVNRKHEQHLCLVF